MEFVTAYGPKLKVALDGFEKTLTKQSMKEECNINFILQKFQKTGVIEHEKQFRGDYAEFDAIDYHEALNAVRAAEEMFETVPSSIRKRFNNDPGEFLAFTTNAENQEEIYNLGLAERPPLEPTEAPAELGGETGV